MTLSPVYTLVYAQPTEEDVVIGEFDNWEMLASLMTEECTTITEESFNTELTSQLSCWFMKLMASDIVKFDNLYGEKMVYTWPDSGITGMWQIRLADTGITVDRTISWTNRNDQTIELELEKSVLNGEVEYNVRTKIETLEIGRTTTTRTITQGVSSWDSKREAIKEMQWLMNVHGYETTAFHA